VAKVRKPIKFKNRGGNRTGLQTDRLRMIKSMVRMENATKVMTWKIRPARAMSTPDWDLPLEVDDMAPPTACRIRLMMSQGMKM
jgi:hypothetical protein